MPSTKTASLNKVLLATIAAFGLSYPALANDADADTAEVGSDIISVDIGLDPAALALATQIIEIGFPEDTRESLFFDTMDQMMVQMRLAIGPTLPDDDDGAIAVLDEWILEHIEESKAVMRKHIPAIMDGMAQSYANIFSVQELTDILAFVETPSGKRYFALSPQVLSDKAFADANQDYIDETVSMMPAAREELRERLDQYFENKEANEATPDA